MALDDAMKSRLDGISRSYQALTERLADPDVIADSNLLMQVMKDRSLSEEVVMAYTEVRYVRVFAKHLQVAYTHLLTIDMCAVHTTRRRISRSQRAL